MIKILVIGQTPPPYGGQSIMIKKMVDAELDKVTIKHIQLNVSESMKGLGNFTLNKVFHSLKVIIKALCLLFTESIDIVYYPPAGNGLNPVLRDIITLILIRKFAKRVVLHFHAGGLSDYILNSNLIIKLLAKLAYNSPSAAIQISSFCPADADYVEAKKTFIIPNGVDDEKNKYIVPHESKQSIPIILFVGVLMESKGIFVLLDALKIINEKNFSFTALFMGEFAYYETEQRFQETVQNYQLQDKVKLLGVLAGEEKWQAYATCDIFCFPTYFESETFGIVLLEAMMFEVPVIATQWRGIQEVVDDGKTGYLIPIKDPKACAERLQILLENPDLRKSMGILGREKFLREYTSERFLDRMESAFLEIVEGS